MTCLCKNWCDRFAAPKNPRGGSLKEQGIADCRTCDVYVPIRVLIRGVICPCCKNKVRLKSRNGQPKEPDWPALFGWLFCRIRSDIPERVSRWRWAQVRKARPFVGDSA